MARVILDQISKEFEGRTVVDKLDLEIEDGEFLVVVGPSGCGKSTTLRMLAGLEAPTSGAIVIGKEIVNAVSPKDRQIGMVFQNYALFPHMTIEKNLMFGLRVRGVERSEARREVEEMAQLLGIDPLLAQKPAQLSGGERQRVALGRALLRRPAVFLLDEPLSNLDAALRNQMRFELKRIHAQFPVTTIYVTHDQVEAMTMADRIALMRSGRLQQHDSPAGMYQRPVNSFVAGFIGSPKMNLVPAGVRAAPGWLSIQCLGIKFQRRCDGTLSQTVLGEGCMVGFRPEDVSVCEERSIDLPLIRGTVEVIEPLGADTFITVRVGDHLVQSRCGPSVTMALKSEVFLAVDPGRVHVFGSDGVALTAGPGAAREAAVDVLEVPFR